MPGGGPTVENPALHSGVQEFRRISELRIEHGLTGLAADTPAAIPTCSSIVCDG